MNWKIYNTDCIEFMESLKDKEIDTIFADPPYGNKTNYKTYNDTRENLKILVNKFMPQALRVAKRVVITPGVKNIYLYPEYTWILSWVNMAGVGSSSWGFCCWQPILVYGKDPFLQQRKGRRPDTYIQKGNTVAKVNHPCPKPNNVMNWIIERTTISGETILDPFMGSGTTGIESIKLNRSFIGCEIDSDYFKIAKDQLENTNVTTCTNPQINQ